MSKVKCEDCTFGFLKKLMGELGPCTRLDDDECPNYNEETDTIEMDEEGAED